MNSDKNYHKDDDDETVSGDKQESNGFTLSSLLKDYLDSEQTQKFALNSVVFGGVLGTLFTIAVAIYALFYAVYMPSVMNEMPVYLQYQDGSLPYDTLNFTSMQDRARPGQHYDLAVRFTIPLSSVNFDLGNFMVCITLCDWHNETISVGCRPVLVPYKSPLLRWLLTFWNLPSLLLGLRTERQSFTVPLFAGIDVSRLSHARLTMSNPSFQVYHSQLIMTTKFQGLAYFMYHWWFLSALFFVAMIMLAEIIILSSGWALLSELLREQDTNDVDGEKNETGKPSPELSYKTDTSTSPGISLPGLLSEATSDD